MKKLSLLVLICMLFSIVGVSLMSCDEVHTHAYGTEWVMDKENHYHTCVCGEKSESAAHADTDNDEACDTCGITMKHTAHVYAETWSYDAENHYHACAECSAKSDTAAHADADNNGACDTCAVIMTNTHVYDPAWTADATNHWHAVLCGHAVEVSGSAAHTPDALGVCTVCGYESTPDVSTIAKALAAAALAQKEVIGGSVDVESPYAYNSVNYEYGKNYISTYDSNGYSTYAVVLEDGSVYYVAMDMNAFENPVTIIENAGNKYLDGPEVNLGNLYIGVEDSYFGIVALLNFFYNDFRATADDGYNTLFEEDYDEESGCFSFSYKLPYVAYEGADPVDVEYSVEFCLADDYYISDFYIQILKPAEGTTILYGSQTGIDYSDISPDKVVPTEFEFSNENYEAIEFTNGTSAPISAFVGSYKINLTATAPEYALLGALEGDITVVVKDGDGQTVAASVVYATYVESVGNEGVNLEFKTPGTYYVNVTINETVYVIPFEVSYLTPVSIEPLYYNAQYWMYEETYMMPSTNIYTGQKLNFAAKLPTGCELNKYTITIRDNQTGATISALPLEDDGFGGMILPFEFLATEAGEYTLDFTSTVDASVTASLTLYAEVPPTIEELATGKWEAEIMMGSASVNFYPTDTTKGVAVVSVSRMGMSETVTFTYYIHDGEFVATVYGEPGMMIQSLSITADYKVAINEEDYYSAMIFEQIEDTADDYAGVDPMPEAPGYVPGNPTLTSSTNVLATGTTTYDVTVAAGTKGQYAFVLDVSVSGANWTVCFTVDGDVTATAENYNSQEVSITAVPLTDDLWYCNLFLDNTSSSDPVTVTVTVVIAEAN